MYPDTPNTLRYGISVMLDTKQHFLTGTEQVQYTNNTGKSLDSIYFYLYPNSAFDSGSVAMRESSRFASDKNTPAYPDTGYTHIAACLVDKTPAGFTLDDTLMRITLPDALQPGRTTVIDLDFVTKIPASMERFGHYDGNYYMALWYPKAAPYDKQGWALDVMHSFGPTEFYGDFAAYDVEITVPADFVIGATGELRGEELSGGRKKTHWYAENVHDFAWVADAHYSVAETEWNGIKIRSLYFNEAKVLGTGGESAVLARDAIAFFSETFGMYPYKNFTVAAVKPFGWAMEYPQLIMNTAAAYEFVGTNMLEILIAHETAHQWWYGIVGNHETKEPWLDEGFATYSEFAYMESKYGPNASLIGASLSWLGWFTYIPNMKETYFSDYYNAAKSGLEAALNTIPYKQTDEKSSLPYQKGMLLLMALKNMLGDELFGLVIRTYYTEFSFKNAATTDFIRVAETVSGRDLDGFFRDWYAATNTCDFVLEALSTKKIANRYYNRIIVRQAGSMVMPAWIEAKLKDGTVLRRQWEAPDTMGSITLVTDSPVVFARIDPDNMIAETDKFNNSSFPGIQYRPYPGTIGASDAFTLSALAYPFYDEANGFQVNGLFYLLHYLDWSFQCNGSYSVQNNTFKYYIGYTQRTWELQDANLMLSFEDDLSAYNLAARFGFSLPAYDLPLFKATHTFQLSAHWLNLYDPGAAAPDAFTGALYYGGAAYSYNALHNYGLQQQFSLHYNVLPAVINAEYNFHKLSLNYSLLYRLWWNLYFNMRLTGSALFGNALARDQDSLNSMAGFANYPALSPVITGINAELKLPVPFINRVDIFGVPFSLGLFAFCNLGRNWSVPELTNPGSFDFTNMNNYSMEAGIKLGLGFAQQLVLKLVFPLWVNQEAAAAERVWFKMETVLF